jgi:hypothetical protein
MAAAGPGNGQEALGAKSGARVPGSFCRIPSRNRCFSGVFLYLCRESLREVCSLVCPLHFQSVLVAPHRIGSNRLVYAQRGRAAKSVLLQARRLWKLIVAQTSDSPNCVRFATPLDIPNPTSTKLTTKCIALRIPHSTGYQP